MDKQSPSRDLLARDEFAYPVSCVRALALGAFKDLSSLEAAIEDMKNEPPPADQVASEPAPAGESAADEYKRATRRKEAEKRLVEDLRLTHAGFIIRIEEAGLHHKAGFDKGEAYLESIGRPWPGPEITHRMQQDYLAIAKGLPDAAARSTLCGLKVRAAVARIQSDPCVLLLAKAIGDGESAEAIRCAVSAAKRALGKGKSDPKARVAANNVLYQDPAERKGRQRLKEIKVQGKATTAQMKGIMEAMGRQGLAFMEMAMRELRSGAGIAQAVEKAAAKDSKRGHRKYPREAPAEPVPKPVPKRDANSARATVESAVQPGPAEPVVEPVQGAVPGFRGAKRPVHGAAESGRW